MLPTTWLTNFELLWKHFLWCAPIGTKIPAATYVRFFLVTRPLCEGLMRHEQQSRTTYLVAGGRAREG